MSSNHEFSISEIARIFDIKRDTLLYYDKIGLFKAKERKDNNYRTYTAEQLPLLDTILNLRELGIPVKTIKEFTKKRSTDSFLSIANETVESIDREMEKLKERQKLLQATIDDIIPASSAEYGVISVIEQEEIPISLSEEGDYSAALFSFNKPYEDFMMKYSVPWTEIAGLSFDISSLDLRDYTKASRLFSKKGKIKNDVQEKGIYAVSYQKGRWSDSVKWYKSMIEQIKGSGYLPVGPCYEEYPIAHLVEEREENFVTKISIRIAAG